MTRQTGVSIFNCRNQHSLYHIWIAIDSASFVVFMYECKRAIIGGKFALDGSNYTMRGDRRRLISAWKAGRYDRDRYENLFLE